ncbi:hypothetical protein [Streptomyces sp. NPDC003710]
MTEPRNGRRAARARPSPARTVILLVALAGALLTAVLSTDGGAGSGTPQRTLVARLPDKARAADLASISARARAVKADFVILVPPQREVLPPFVPDRRSTWTPDAALARHIAGMEPPTVVSLTEVPDPHIVAQALPSSVEAVDETGTVLRAADASAEEQGTSPLRVMGLLVVGLLVVPTAKALVRQRGRPGPARRRGIPDTRPALLPQTPPQPPPYDPAPGAGAALEAAPGTPEAPPPPTGTRPASPPAFDIRAFAATLTGPESGPQCPRCGSFDLSQNPSHTSFACGDCAHVWRLDPLGRPPQLLLQPEHIARGLGGRGGKT